MVRWMMMWWSCDETTDTDPIRILTLLHCKTTEFKTTRQIWLEIGIIYTSYLLSHFTVRWENTTPITLLFWRTEWEWQCVLFPVLFLPGTLTGFLCERGFDTAWNRHTPCCFQSWLCTVDVTLKWIILLDVHFCVVFLCHTQMEIKYRSLLYRGAC